MMGVAAVSFRRVNVASSDIEEEADMLLNCGLKEVILLGDNKGAFCSARL